jgi:signal transduction histidine kinase
MIFRQSSFRRILLSRLLLVSLPVLLLGVYFTYRKARSAFLETARQNLTESAARKGESIRQSMETLRLALVTASDSVVFKSGSQRDYQAFLKQLSTTLPTEIHCLQLQEINTLKPVASTCGNQDIGNFNPNLWSKQQEKLLANPKTIEVNWIPPAKQSNLPARSANNCQLTLVLTAPVYDNKGQLRYALSIQSSLLQREKVPFGSLTGYPAVINQDGTILAHPFPERIGQNIKQEADAARLENLIGSAITGKQDFLHLFSFEKNGVELVAGYTSIPSPLSRESEKKWIILAVMPLKSALASLEEIKWVLAYLILALILASFLTTLYIAWELARPLEKLRDYALNPDNLHSQKQIPQDLKIREFNDLAIAIQDMIERLKTWGEELITSWKEAQNANQLKSEFLATTSHELRTPLNGIIGCIRIVKEGYCDSRQEELEFLQQADDAAVHLVNLINDILDIAKIESGKLSVTIETVDLLQILTEVINLQSVPIPKKRLKFNLPSNEKTIKVLADPAKLKQVLLNVVGNAVKFTESGSITIKIKTDSPNSQVIVTVKDTGIGIEPSQQEKLFRPFVMVDGSTTRKFGGTGLGLAISRNLVELMGGSITLFSAGLGKGTTVEISLPLLEISSLPDITENNGNHRYLSALNPLINNSEP